MLTLTIPDTNFQICEGDIIKLGRFEDTEWEVHHGWFSFGGNRPWCGWYLTSNVNGQYIEKPIQLPDLEDVYVIHKSLRRGCQ